MSERVRFPKQTGYGQIFDDSIRRCPDREAIVFGSWRITYRELGQHICRAAHFLEARGLKRGDRAAIISRNCPEYLILEFAMYKLGIVPVKFNWRLTADEMIYLMDFNQVRCAFLRVENPVWGQQLLDHYAGKLPIFVLEGAEEADSTLMRALADQPDDPVETVLPDGDVACHAHTSGTTGHAKTVVYTHGGMLNEIEAVADMYGYEDGQRYQFIAQLFHSASIGAHLSLCTGGTIVLMCSFSADTYMQSLVRERVTAISVVPTVLKWILDEMEKKHYDLSGLRVIRYSTCPIPPILLDRAMKSLNCVFYQSYGMTEMCSIVTALLPEDHFSDGGRHLTTVGRPIPGAAVKIVDEEGRDCPVGETGEIYVQGPGHMKEYLGKEELTRQRTQGGWYHTGDMGFLDADGYLSISGRMDDMIISGGENIYPGEVTNVIMRLNNDVSEVAVYGVPDETWGEQVKASVVLVPGSRLTGEEIRRYCRDNMPHFQVPREVEILPELPKNPSGKVLIQELKRRSQK